MTIQHGLLTAFACGHLLLVVCGATQTRPVPRGTAASEVLSTYQSLSGADTGYGFFAPGVAPQYRLRFEMTDAEGRTWQDALQGANSEAQLRFSGIAALLAMVDDAEGERILRSLAGTMLGRHGNAKQVTVRIETYGIVRPDGAADFPTMEEYRNGARPEWLLLHERAYTRSPDADA